MVPTTSYEKYIHAHASEEDVSFSSTSDSFITEHSE